MKTMFLAAVAALSLGVGSAYAQGAASASGYAYPDFWGTQATQQPALQGHPVTESNGDVVGTYATHTEHNGTWLFPADPWGGGGG